MSVVQPGFFGLSITSMEHIYDNRYRPYFFRLLPPEDVRFMHAKIAMINARAKSVCGLATLDAHG
jgi:hypothetical protein